MAETIYIDTDHTARFGVLKRHSSVDDVAGTALTGATVTVVLLDKNRQTVSSPIKPFPMTFTDAGNGNYRAPIPNDHELEGGVIYYGRFKAVSADGIQRVWDAQFEVKQGTF